MRTEEFHKLLEDPKNVADYLVDDLRALAMKYPYSQVIQLMYGLKLRSSSEHLFNQQLGKTAVLSNDRSVLFELFENKAPQVNTGLEIVEVDQSVPEIKPAIKPEVPDSEPEIVKPDPISESESIKDSARKEEVSKAEYETLPASSAAEIPSEPAKEESLAAPVEAKRPSEPLPSGIPENMEGLSPQERVKAILERNRQLRAQFEAAKSTGEEKLFEEAKAEATKEETPRVEPIIEEGEISSQSPETEKTEAQDAQPQKSEETASTDEPELPTSKSEEPEEPNLVPPIEELSPETDNSKDQEPDTESNEEQEPSPEPWADTPIDIEALIRRRFARRYEADTADDNNSEEDEVDPWSDDEWAAAGSTTADDPSVEAIEETEVNREPEASEESEAQAAELNDEHLETEPEPQSDLAMAARIRIITDRLDTLQEQGDFSQEELQSLMDEHRRLEEALTSDLPADEKQLFEVDAKDSDSDLATPEETAKELVEVQGEVNVPEPEGAEAAEEDLAATPEAYEKEEINLASTASDSKTDASEDKDEPAQDEDSKSLEGTLATDIQADEKQLFKIDAEDSDSDLETLEETSKELVEVQGEVVIPEPKEDEEASQDDHPPIKETPAPEQKQSEISPSPEVMSQVEEEEARDENDVDAEIRRIEALAARLRNGPNREMSQTEINQLREKRMEEMISDRKKSLEASKNVEEPQKDAVEDGLSADATQASNQETNDATSPQVDSDSAASEQEENPWPSKPLEVRSTEPEELKEGEPQEDLSVEKNETKATDESEAEASQDLAIEASTQEDPQEDGQVEPAEELVPEASYATEDTAEEEQSGTSLAATEPESESDDSKQEITSKEEESPSADLSFSDWLKRISNQKVETSSSAKEASPEREEEVEEPRAEIAEKIDLLDSFVEKLPELKKQSRASSTAPKPKSSSLESADSEGAGGLVTETLAKVYIRQKHYKKAIQAYEILMLKYPEKSSFFASQILEIKKLENSK